LLEELEPRGPLPRRDRGVVEGMNEGQAALALELPRHSQRLHPISSVQHDLGAIASACVHLWRRRRGGHDDDGVHACCARRPRERLRVIPGRERHDAALPRPRVELADFVERAARLE
jgi:hypothetical protein